MRDLDDGPVQISVGIVETARFLVVVMAQVWPKLWELGLAIDATYPQMLMLRLKLGPIAVGLDFAWRKSA